MFTREIRPEVHVHRNPFNKKLVREIEFAMFLEGEFVGYARSYLDAELTLNEIVFERLSSGSIPTLAEAVAARVEIVEVRKAA